MNKEKVISLPISKFIDTKFRDYSVYVLEARGIPSFFDALTPVQRYILMNSATSFSKTLSIVGKSIDDGYHHGDAGLSKALAKLARPFGASLQLLDGYGFFGTEVCPAPAAARYTSVKLNTDANSIIKKYKHLTTREEGGPYDPFWVDVPIGLCTTIVGIAVGYKTTMLPRKLSDIRAYLKGEIKSLKPYFMDFGGSIAKHDTDRTWLLSSNINVEGNKIKIRDIPPILKYTSVLKKLDYLFTKFESKIKVVNNSNTKVIVDIIYSGRNKTEWKEIQEFTSKVFSIIVTENPVFIKDGNVLVYDSVEQYLNDYKWQILRLKYHNTLYERNWLYRELAFNEAKKLFITFMLQKRRTVAEVDIFLVPFDDDVKDRLERLTSKKFTKDELEICRIKITELKKNLRIKERELKKAKKEYEKKEDPTLKRGISSKKTNVDLFDIDDVDEIDGIIVWDGADVFGTAEKIEEE